MEKQTVHVLKTDIEFFEHVVNGSKRFEVRLNDRNFKTGDIGVLWSNHIPFDDGILLEKNLSPIVYIFEIGYILNQAHRFTKEGYVTFSILESNLSEIVRITLCKHLMNFDFCENNWFEFSHLKS